MHTIREYMQYGKQNYDAFTFIDLQTILSKPIYNKGLRRQYDKRSDSLPVQREIK